MYGKDEIAWCLDVVQPVLNCSLKGSRRLQLTSVQSQLIDAELLSTMKSSLMCISKKADYAYSFSCRDAEVSHLYQHISFGGNGYQIGHTTDAFNKRTILFSGIEVKPDDEGKKEVLAQLSIRLNATLEKMRRLQVLAKGSQPVPMNLLPTVGLTVIGHDWYTYIAYRLEDEMGSVASSQSCVHVLMRYCSTLSAQ
ncbi:hypothetical protein P168DRAFT_136543 [Aspergillus campestris IBT 28561]|uniref:PD-(D/E)XK nuclease-like domain-containing protein n=1 Tax=Aspergillus campestris (strain IBT 28561) TaxID=1392248 RepID=A0A2I1D3Y6_ASPC2|nr:uncharacterized protein P168DRAFT_136543 [Aspergillus campestris IBT 28561]PKY04585.1 hypothetical protein P168DRAFT_136543 [Aspergillus campestris IBT 28561]